MLLVAAAAHAIIILGVSFNVDLPNEVSQPAPTLDIILVHHHSEKPPEKADYLAQVSQEGGGNREDKVRPQSPVSSPKVLPQKGPTRKASGSATSKPAPQRTRRLTRRVERAATPVAKESRPSIERKKRPTALQLMNYSVEIAQLSAAIDESFQAHAQRPRHKFISARTQAYAYASYMEAWRQKVERIGNLNYPEEAKRRKLSGALLLDVALNADGSIYRIELRRSSGNKVLDDAAIRIVRLASPFAPFPDDIHKETDILHITRTWQFRNDARVFSR